VGEVLVGIVDADPDSYRAVDRSWRPTLPAATADRYGIADLIRAPALANARRGSADSIGRQARVTPDGVARP
jgi:hypothetical protein